MKNCLSDSASLLISLLFVALAFPDTSYAYIDPGTGSILIQALVAAVASVAFAVKIYWARLKVFFRKSPSGSKDGKPDKLQSLDK